jgi:two-component system sensor histidine kinase BaeS
MTHAVATDASHSDTANLAVWGFSTSLAILGTAILFDASLGINWGVWTACVVIAFFAVLRERIGSVGAPSIAAGSWAVVLAFGTAITSDGFRIGVLVLATVLLLAIALATAGDRSIDALRPLVALQAPFSALGVVFSGLATEASGSARTARSPAVSSLVRTTLITLPLVILLIFLLAEADPIFAAAKDALEHIVPKDFVPRTIFFVVLFGVTLGAYGNAQRGRLEAHQSAGTHGVMLGALERRVLMLTLASIMWLFVGDATLSLLKNPAAIAGSGITYAEYVHRGFAELSVAATIVIGAALVTRRSWIAEDAWARRAAFASIAGECGMIAIAFMRVVRYEQAYGFTAPRLYAQGYMVVLGCMSVLLLVEIVRRAQSIRFAYHSASAGLAVLFSFVLVNTDAWIVRQNVDRYVESGKLDAWYLASELSDDATPALVESVSRLHEPERSIIIACLRNKDEKRRHPDGAEWYSWNYRKCQSAKAARVFRGNDIGGAGASPDTFRYTC